MKSYNLLLSNKIFKTQLIYTHTHMLALIGGYIHVYVCAYVYMYI